MLGDEAITGEFRRALFRGVEAPSGSCELGVVPLSLFLLGLVASDGGVIWGGESGDLSGFVGLNEDDDDDGCGNDEVSSEDGGIDVETGIEGACNFICSRYRRSGSC